MLIPSFLVRSSARSGAFLCKPEKTLQYHDYLRTRSFNKVENIDSEPQTGEVRVCDGDVSSFVHRIHNARVFCKVYKMRHTYRNRKSNTFDIFRSITFTNRQRVRRPPICACVSVKSSGARSRISMQDRPQCLLCLNNKCSCRDQGRSKCDL